LRSRNRNVADFHIRPDEPYKKYNAGEHVRGAVILVVVKPVRITHLVVSLNGYVRVCKEPAASAKAQNALTLPHGSSAQPRYHGNGFATLFGDEQVLSGDGRIEPGKYEFGFDLVFPEKGLPSSIDVR
jgi:arrestin-related trafficking adapter 9